MISIEAYRSAIGRFYGKAKKEWKPEDSSRWKITFFVHEFFDIIILTDYGLFIAFSCSEYFVYLTMFLLDMDTVYSLPICGYIRFQISEDGTKIKDVQETISSKWNQGPPVPDPLMYPLPHPYTHIHTRTTHPYTPTPTHTVRPVMSFQLFLLWKDLNLLDAVFNVWDIMHNFTLNKLGGPLMSAFSCSLVEFIRLTWYCMF